MLLINYLLNFFVLFLKLINTVHFTIFIISITLIINILVYFLVDRKYIKNAKKFWGSDHSKMEDLNFFPLVNIIVPAWKEGENFKKCLLSITKLSYPNLKVIVNAGGSEETINIANSFKNYKNFIILRQKEGGGKIKAINDALYQVSEGIVNFIDADFYLSDENLINLLYPIVNRNQDVVISSSKPYKSKINKDLVKYIYISRYSKKKNRFSRHNKLISSNTCLKYEVIKSVGKFPEKQLLGDGRVIGTSIINKGYKILKIYHPIEVFDYPEKIRVFISQNVRWIENSLLFRYRNNKIKFIKAIFSLFMGIYILIFPFFILLNFGLFMIGLCLLLNFYLKTIRYYTFYIKTKEQKEFQKTHFIFFIKIFYYIYIEIIIKILSFFELIFNKKKYRERKNISHNF